MFIVADNRRPQATFAWILLFILLPGFGLVIYVLFGRELRDFSRKPGMVHHDLDHGADSLRTLFEAQDAPVGDLVARSGPQGRLARLVCHNGHSALTSENRVKILQDAQGFYPRKRDHGQAVVSCSDDF